jgi:Xaa-Pro aminopeptidase
MLDKLPGEKIRYANWTTQRGPGAATLGLAAVAMQYSPNCAVPYVSMVDAGTVELVRSLGVEVRTSADLVQHFEARWSCTIRKPLRPAAAWTRCAGGPSAGSVTGCARAGG